jgi:hypothetical protein
LETTSVGCQNDCKFWMGKMWREVIMAYLVVLSQCFRKWTEEIHKKPQSGKTIFESR